MTDSRVIFSKPLYSYLMKIRKNIIFILGFFAMIFSINADAQYYEVANTLQSMIRPALTGGGRYKGFVEAGYSHTLSKYNGDFIEVSTSQGYQYNSWFFMGVGLGVDVLFAHKNDHWGEGMTTPPGGPNPETITTAPMMPLFTDFRFNIGNTSKISFFLDLKVGCSFLLSNRYIPIGDGYLTNREYFFLDPSLGIRVPVSKKHPKQAFDVGIRYKLLTSNYWYKSNNNITLQSLGAFLAFEW